MTPEAKFRPEHAVLANLIEHVLRSDQASMRVPELAEIAGFSRFHLSRRFHEVTGETLEGFLRRVRLERAAFALRSTAIPVLAIATECGYRSPEAFSRAFKLAFGVSPSEFRGRADLSWQLGTTADVHWNSDWRAEDPRQLRCFVETDLVYRPARTVAVWRVVGNYSELDEGWVRLAQRFRKTIPPQGRFITIYLDNMWTHPTPNTMRADIGWEVPAGFPAPDGMRLVTVAAGRYAVTRRFLAREERNDGWSYMCGRWQVERHLRRRVCSYDEYRAWPLPFEQVETRIWVGLGPL